MFTGDQIREARRSAGLTQAELAERLGVSMRTVGNWERGETDARVSDSKVRAALGEHLGGSVAPRKKGVERPLEAVSDVELLAEIARRFARGNREEQSHVEQHPDPDPIPFPSRGDAVAGGAEPRQEVTAEELEKIPAKTRKGKRQRDLIDATFPDDEGSQDPDDHA